MATALIHIDPKQSAAWSGVPSCAVSPFPRKCAMPSISTSPCRLKARNNEALSRAPPTVPPIAPSSPFQNPEIFLAFSYLRLPYRRKTALYDQ
jgi:hypothetical protein